MKTSSSVTTQAAVSEHHTSVMAIMIVEIGLMKETAVSDISAYLTADAILVYKDLTAFEKLRS